MRIRSLRLIAFGPFSGRELALSGDGIPRDALHVVYGPNEAGKSTALRAIEGLLFGIPAQTGDAHLHRMADLRVGAVLEGANGELLEVVRRKGNKNTLLDPADNLLDEAVFRRVCGSASGATFRALFGLDHVSLREGAEALLAGRGDVGESLFDAALGGGGRGIHRVLLDLEGEADALFAPHAQKRKLNEAIRAYQDARGRSRDTARSGEAWQKQTEGLDTARRERERLLALGRERKKDLHRLQRMRRLLPLTAARERLQERVAALAGVVVLPPAAGQERTAALAARQQARAELDRLEREIAVAQAARDQLRVPRWLDDPATARLEDLPNMLGAEQKAAADRPRLVGTLAALEDDARNISARVRGEAASPSDARTASTPAALVAGGVAAMPGIAGQARIRKLALDEGTLVQGLTQAERRLLELERRRQARVAALERLPAAREVGPLRAALRRAEDERPLEAEIDRITRDRDRLEPELARRLRALGLAARPPAELLALAVPPGETVDHFSDRLQALAPREERLREELAAVNRRKREVDRAIAELESQGAVPSYRALAEARAAREASWQQVRAALAARAGAPEREREDVRLSARYEQQVAQADDVADRLGREADRVARAAALEAERESLASAGAEAHARGDHLREERTRTEAAWQAAWQPVGVAPQSPTEMRVWLRRFGEVAEMARLLERASGEIEDRRARLQLAHARLASALPAPYAAGLAKEAPFTVLCDHAAALVTSAQENARQREDLVEALAAQDEELAQARSDREAAAAGLAAWRQHWAAAIEPLGLAADTSAAEATAVLEAAGELAHKQDEAAKLRRRLQGIDRDTTQFEQRIDALATALSPELRGRPARELAEQLLVRHREGLQARRDHDRLDKELTEYESDRRAATSRLEAAEGELGRLLAAAGVADLGALEEAERRSAEVRDLQQQLAANEGHILAAADGLRLQAALDEVKEASAEEVETRLDAAQGEVDTLDQDLQRANHTIGGLEKGLDALDTAEVSDAADAAAEAQAHLARVRSVAEQYARLRLAARLLGREVERHRERHQGPVLARAGELLARLTGGHYTGLRADFDQSDQPVLRCVRDDGTRVPVEGLSDGARDQLYLSLRLASLERRAAGGEPLPLILDDILIHFDDDRARAALTVLAQHARSTQVVLFTHHARVIELAEGAIPAPGLRVSRLQS